MKTQPIEAAVVSLGDDGTPFSPAYGDVYHARGGALAQAAHVFLAGNDLPARWRGRDRFCVLETGFGLGNNFIATWNAWRRDPARCRRLHYVSIELHPPSVADLQRVHASSALPELAAQLIASWPPFTWNLHRRSFDDGGIELSLAFGDVGEWLPEMVLQADAFYLDGYAPTRNPQMWRAPVFKALARLAAPEATAATWSTARDVRDALAAAGFTVATSPGFAGKREMTRARFSPRFVPRRPPARSASRPDAGHAVIVGAGLAGCAAAWALARQGWSSTLLERRDGLARETSGNAAGLFHGSVNAPDGVHARFSRAAALETARFVRHAGAAGLLAAGGVTGALRVESRLSFEAMQRVTNQLGLPSQYVTAVDAPAARDLSSLAVPGPAWFYPEGGWLVPAQLAAAFLAAAGDTARLRLDTPVAAVRRDTEAWALLDTDGQVIERASVVVLASAIDTLRLLPNPRWPLEVVRGQITSIPATSTSLRPLMPVAGAGYVLPAHDGVVVCGATQQPGDLDAALRRSDHLSNLAQLERLTGARTDACALGGRVAWRLVAKDRLPLVGAVPEFPSTGAPGVRLDQPRFVPRAPGLFVFTALASRGITWAALGAQALASLVTGAPCPVEASLLDAIDPARFASRDARRSG